MSIKLTCEHCGREGKVNERLAGRRVKCPGCEQPIVVPKLVVPKLVVPESPDPEPGASDPVHGNGPAGDELANASESAAVTAGFETDPITGADSFSSATPDTPLTDPSMHVDAAVPSTPSMMLDADDDAAEDEVLVRAEKPEDEMDMTPMVDVTFLLLIFFMVTAAFSLQKSIEMPRQQTDQPSNTQSEPDDKEVVELQVDEYGTFTIITNEWERQTPGKQNLITTLKEAAAASSEPMALKVQVQETAKIKSLVDAMDAGTIAAYAPIEVTQVTEFE